MPSFGEVFFDARGQERCLRVTWHEGTLVLSLWRGEMCTASFRMPMDDVGRLLDTLDDGYAEASGEQPAVPEQDPVTEAIPGTGQYHRPPAHGLQPPPPQHDERPTTAPNDVLVARGPAHQDKLVASYPEPVAPRDAPTPQYGERSPFTGPQYADPHTGEPIPAYREPARAEPFSGPQYAEPDTFGGRPYTLDPEPFSGPQYMAGGHETHPHYQLPDGRPVAPSTDPLGFPSQAAQSYPAPRQDRPAPSDYGYQQQPPPPSREVPGAAGLGTPMHGIPGAGRRQAPAPAAGRDRYPGQDGYQGYQPQIDPLDPLASPYPRDHGTPDISRPYVGDPMFSTGERLRPDQYDDRDDRREW
ncbi:hypothetical protein GCM10012289_48660 [Nonomuraea cavernae]|uniref:Uncharacterized protein n=1 Tax=Nonomuraea cavernae TaxID=2045107 RepID=A0A918DN54_9ACTN|nr:hypothetical protein GCM10012289_48660 [Nonomuraea cavernae]